MSELLRTREQRNVNNLEPHSFNTRIYNVETEDLEEKIEQHGFEPIGRLQIKPDGTILSGHRRWEAAKEVGLDEVPVEVVEPESEMEEKRLILLANEYRDKTPAEKIREGEAWEELETAKSKKRNKETGGPSPEKLPDTDKGDTRDKVGEKIGVSGKTYETGKKVKEKADGGDKTAQEQWEKMERGEQSIHGAMKEVKKSENQTDDDPEPEQSDPRDEHTKLSLQRVCDDGAAIYTDSRGNTYLVESDDLPK
jgi:ParB family chromosome partitioning protein